MTRVGIIDSSEHEKDMVLRRLNEAVAASWIRLSHTQLVVTRE